MTGEPEPRLTDPRLTEPRLTVITRDGCHLC